MGWAVLQADRQRFNFKLQIRQYTSFMHNHTQFCILKTHFTAVFSPIDRCKPSAGRDGESGGLIALKSGGAYTRAVLVLACRLRRAVKRETRVPHEPACAAPATVDKRVAPATPASSNATVQNMHGKVMELDLEARIPARAGGIMCAAFRDHILYSRACGEAGVAPLSLNDFPCLFFRVPPRV